MIEWWPSLPVVLLAATAVLVLLVGLIGSRPSVMLSVLLCVAGMGAAFYSISRWVPAGNETFNAFLRYDSLGRSGAMIALAAGVLIALVSVRTIRLYDLPPSEYYSLLVFAVFGMVTLCLSAELITLLLGVEIIAVSIYVMVGLLRRCRQSAEASLKYFILGAFSSAFLIFGIAFLYGGSGGSTMLDKIGVAMARVHPLWALGSLSLGLVLAVAGFSFKLTLVPFHLYAADVYQGAPTPVAALLATGSKVAGFVALVHILMPLHEHSSSTLTAMAFDQRNILWLLAALSIVVGNVVALLQRNIKRMLAYSSIAHSGYLLIGVLVFVDGTVGRNQVETALLVYLVAYVLMNVTAFGVASVLGERGERNVEDYAGLARRSPVLALAMVVAMLSLTGIPATAGFIGKLFVFAAAVKAGIYLLVIIAVLGSAISAYYYLRVVVYMYMHEPAEEAAPEAIGLAPSLGLLLSVVPIVVFGILPQVLLRILEVF